MEKVKTTVDSAKASPKDTFADNLDGAYWNNRYESNATQWDLGCVSPPLKAYIDQITDKNLRILIPGCGNTYEAAYLLENGFTDITLIDIAPALVKELKKTFSSAPQVHIILGDFFEHEGKYDLILEQTFFCAIDPQLRERYVAKMNDLLDINGKLVGVLFNTVFEHSGPPFGGDISDYEVLFGKKFNIQLMEKCYNSFVKRKETELFIKLQKHHNKLL